MEKTELIPFLEKLKGKSLILKNSGYMSCRTSVKKFDFYVKYNILTMKDHKSENYMVLNLDRIKEIRREPSGLEITIYINDEIETEIAIEYKKILKF